MIRKINNTTNLPTLYRFNAPKKVFGGPLYGVVDSMTEADFAELLNPELEPIKRELRSGVAIKLRFLDYNEVFFIPFNPFVNEKR